MSDEWPTEYCKQSPTGCGAQRVMVTMPSLHMMSPATMQIHAKCEAADGNIAPLQDNSGIPPSKQSSRLLTGSSGSFYGARCCRARQYEGGGCTLFWNGIMVLLCCIWNNLFRSFYQLGLCWPGDTRSFRTFENAATILTVICSLLRTSIKLQHPSQRSPNLKTSA